MRISIFTGTIFLCGALLYSSSASAEETIQARAAIGIKTTVSGGKHTISGAAAIARKNGVDVLIATDPYLNRWEYGLWPLRNIVRKRIETMSACRYGLERYKSDVEKAQLNNPGIVIIDGLEVAPFYYWHGIPFSPGFAIRDWHKHLLVIGLDTAFACKTLPVIGNPLGLGPQRGLRDIVGMLLVVSVLALGAACLYRGRRARRDVYERESGFLLTTWRRLGIVLTVAGLLLLCSGWPFRSALYDQYSDRWAQLPYQHMIDYVGRHGGVTFWAHPEAKNIDSAGGIRIETRPHTDILRATYGYTGFSVFYEGYEEVGRPGGVWDDLLQEYCGGARRSPVWTIGAVDYERGGDLAACLRDLRTVLLVKRLDRDGALEALRSGRMYVARGPDSADFVLDEFSVRDRGPAGPSGAVMGETVPLALGARIELKGHYVDGRAKSLKGVLIKDGKIEKAFDLEAPFAMVFDDDGLSRSGKGYYRVELRSEGLHLVTNPIFFTGKARQR